MQNVTAANNQAGSSHRDSAGALHTDDGKNRRNPVRIRRNKSIA